MIAEYVAQFLDEAGIMKNGFSFQAGAGGTALAFAIFLKERMKKKNVKARFISGGSTKYLVQMLEEGLTDYILDGQTFDLEGVRSMRENDGHVNTSPFTSYNFHGKGNFASIVDAAVLGATEVDVNFNANVVTHSDGYLLHGIGGWQNCLYSTSPFTSYNFHGKGNFASIVDAAILGATEVDVNFNANVVTHSDGYLLHGIGGWQNCLYSKCTILAIPSFRDRIPVIVDQVTTLCGPGELIDVIATERGLCINPKRKDLLKAMKDSSIPILDIKDLKRQVDEICGGAPAKPKVNKDKVVAIVKWVDGTVLDSVFEVIK